MIKFLDLKKINKVHQAEIKTAVNQTINSGWYLNGKGTKSFEHDLARYIGVEHAIACGNGLDALKIILRGYIELGVISEGDEVIVPANTYIASILAITDNKLTPVFIEPAEDTYNIDCNLIEENISEKTRAIMLVHLYGKIIFVMFPYLLPKKVKESVNIISIAFCLSSLITPSIEFLSSTILKVYHPFFLSIFILYFYIINIM